MLSPRQNERLQANWGEKADCLACYAEVRIYDPLSAWECYLLASNPENPDELACIIKAGRNLEPEVTTWTLSEMAALYNSNGEGVEIDREYRPRWAAELFKILGMK